MKRAAFFDLDGTLLLVNSGPLWFQRERAEGRITRTQAVEAVLWLGLYRVGLMAPDIAFGRAARSVAGVLEEEMDARCARFFDEIVVPKLAPGGLAAVERHREDGDALVLLSTTSPYIARRVAERLGLDAWLCTRFEVRDGAFTGGIVAPVCFGAGKVALAERWAADAGVDVAASTFYTDSITDLPMLERVRRPVVVAPDGRLGRLARRRGWPVVDWSAAPASDDA